VSVLLLGAPTPVHADPPIPPDPAVPGRHAPEDTAAERIRSALPGISQHLLDLRVAAHEAISIAEIAEAAAQRERQRHATVRFTATVARARAEHAQRILNRWAAGLHRNETLGRELVEIVESGLLDPVRAADVRFWLERNGDVRRHAVRVAQELATTATRHEREAERVRVAAEDAAAEAQARREEAMRLLTETETLLQGLFGEFPHQLTVGPDGCPTGAPKATLRGDAATEDVGELCARSVALAPTPEAALAVKYAFRALGGAYACEGVGRDQTNRYDCSSLVTRAYSEGAGLFTATATWIPTTRNLLPWGGAPKAPWAVEIDTEDALPGDLVIYETRHLASRHVVMLLADGFMLHVGECGDVVNITNLWRFDRGENHTFVGVRRVDPAIARTDTSDALIDPSGADSWRSDAAGGDATAEDAAEDDVIIAGLADTEGDGERRVRPRILTPIRR